MIRFPCANLNCQYHLKAREGKVGKKGKCPVCGLVQTIPSVDDLALQTEGMSVDELPGVLGKGSRAAVIEVTRKCLYCGKIVDAEALRCNHCGQWFDRQDVLAEIDSADPANTTVRRKTTDTVSHRHDKKHRRHKKKKKDKPKRSRHEGPLPAEDQYDGPIDLASPAAIGMFVALLAIIGIVTFFYYFLN